MTASPQNAAAADPHRPRVLARWLWIVAAMVIGIVIIGGITRLTESGLSITEWKPITGALPPLSEADWIAEFEKYQRIPEYQQLNAGMTLDAFKNIYFWEWFHRLWGRLIGAAMAIPLAYFAWRRMIPSGFGLRLFGLLLLVGLQGAIGWWMVASGLEVRTDVSHLRLATHLSTALILLAGLVWTASDLAVLASGTGVRRAKLTPFCMVVAALLLLQIVLGAWTAGLNAGQVSNEWPMMGDHWVPAGINWSQGWGYAVTHDPFLIHFLHRWLAWGVAAAMVLLARRAGGAGARKLAALLTALVVTQVGLGIATVMSNITITLAVMHQAAGALLVAVAVMAMHRVSRAAP